MEKNKTGKYLKYAIGEIVLVVIGILIALAINNWNQNRNQEQKTKVIFNQIINELVLDVGIIEDANKYYFYKNSLIDSYKKADFTNVKLHSNNEIDESDLVDMIRSYAPISIHDRGFNLLMNQTDELNNQYKEYIEELLFLYQDVRIKIDFYNKELEEMLEEHRMYKIKNHSWYSGDIKTGKRKPEEFEYYKYNPIYRNYVSYYNEMIMNIIIPSRLFSDKAIKLSRKINSDFNLNRNLDIELSLKNPTSEMIQSIIGTYVNKRNETLIFEERNKQLYESTFDNKGLNYSKESYFVVGELRYLADSIFYRNSIENIQLNSDGRISIINIFNKKPIMLKRVSKQ